MCDFLIDYPCNYDILLNPVKIKSWNFFLNNKHCYEEHHCLKSFQAKYTSHRISVI